jgi:hypothetical protein
VNATEKTEQTAGEKAIHDEQALAVLNVRQFEFGTGNCSAPRILLLFMDGVRSQFYGASLSDRRAE